MLLQALYVGLWAAGFTVVLRALPWIQRLVREGMKPWACDVCMSFWSTFGVTGSLVLTKNWDFAAALPGFAITLLVLRKLTEPVKLPTNLPDLEDSE